MGWQQIATVTPVGVIHSLTQVLSNYSLVEVRHSVVGTLCNRHLKYDAPAVRATARPVYCFFVDFC